MKRSMAVTVATILLGTVASYGTAFGAEQSKAQQKCINALNKSMAKVSQAQTKANGKCIKARAKDGSTDAFLCANGDPKVAAAEQKTLDQESKACTEMPEFGYTGGGNVNNRASFQAYDLAGELFGTNTGVTICENDTAGCKCQGAVLKASNKLLKAHLKNFNKCKKKGLADKNAPFTTEAQISGCVSDDDKGKIAKAGAKLEKAVTKKCAGVATPYAEGECSGDTGATLATCAQQRVRCAACLTEVLSDGLGSPNCDSFDDGDDKNGSCFDDF